MANEDKYKLRRFKIDNTKLITPFGVVFETTAIWTGMKEYTIQLGMLRNISFADLEGIAALFETKNINFAPSESEFYGDIVHSRLEVTIDATKVDKWFYTVEETEEAEKREIKNQKQRELADLQRAAKRHGYNLTKKEKKK